ncbi:Uu.00g029840.m01.CDS01 [Anthostomella pinea]|uniref:Uu.00g029840.m01.CDS01 n=1 Tax=Anthostomella pinea TaxID=933095 RepID=A0AAI8YCU6_9PEZI|nr:Uu.00g029840.m01.CDS01 [Anthostomella pinea]
MRLLAGQNAWILAAVLGLQGLCNGNPVAPKPNSLDALARRVEVPGLNTPSDEFPASRRKARARRGEDIPQLGLGGGFGTAQPIGTYEQKGDQRLAAYDEARKKKTPDTTIFDNADESGKSGDEHKSFFNIYKNEDYFEFDTETIPTTNYPELQGFKSADTGVDLGDIKELEETTIRDATGDMFKEVINLGAYDKKGKIIVAVSAFKENNHTPRGRQYVPINEVGWQVYAHTAEGNVENLKVIFLMNIQNKGFWSITAKNYEEFGKKTDEMVVWEAGHGDALKRFKRFLGSDNINGKLLALTNHHNAIKDKDIAKVITIPKDVPGSQGKFTAALVLE